jgi:hypothetical protein
MMYKRRVHLGSLSAVGMTSGNLLSLPRCISHRPSVGRVGVAILAALSITACSHVPVAVCPPLKTYTPEFNQRLASELESMPADSATVEAIGDYIGLRDQIRACQ